MKPLLLTILFFILFPVVLGKQAAMFMNSMGLRLMLWQFLVLDIVLSVIVYYLAS